ICDGDLCRRVVRHADLVVHLAAESFVDNSFGDPLTFTITNTLGTHMLLEACRIAGVPRFIHVSTDEVYGEVLRGCVEEDAPFNPTNPYSASKAAAEMIILGYLRSYRQPIIRVRANNIFGIRQYPEKVVATVSRVHGCRGWAGEPSVAWRTNCSSSRSGTRTGSSAIDTCSSTLLLRRKPWPTLARTVEETHDAPR